MRLKVSQRHFKAEKYLLLTVPLKYYLPKGVWKGNDLEDIQNME